MLQQVLDFDGRVEGEMGMRCRCSAEQVHREIGRVEEVWVAEGDVFRAGFDLLVDVGEDGLGAVETQSSGVDRREGAVGASVRAAACGFDVSGKMRGAARVAVLGVLVERGQQRAVGNESRLAVEEGHARGGRAIRDLDELEVGVAADGASETEVTKRVCGESVEDDLVAVVVELSGDADAESGGSVHRRGDGDEVSVGCGSREVVRAD